eukprot:753214-Hanusia_phi.AAC.2
MRTTCPRHHLSSPSRARWTSCGRRFHRAPRSGSVGCERRAGKEHRARRDDTPCFAAWGDRARWL